MGYGIYQVPKQDKDKEIMIIWNSYMMSWFKCQVASVLYDNVKVLEVLAKDLETEGEYKVMSNVDTQKRIINMLLKAVQSILEKIDLEELK